MEYILKHSDEPIKYFEIENTFEGLKVSNFSVVEKKNYTKK